jgi:hypothetical protein
VDARELERIVDFASRVTGRAFASRDVVAGERHGFVVVRLANDLMAYVAKDAASRVALATQRRVLARVGQRVTFAMPRPIGAIELEGDVDLRERVVGATGARFHERILRDPTLRARASAWMGETLAELHGALAGIELDTLGVSAPVWPHRLDRLARGIDAHLEGEASERAHALAAAWHARAFDPRRDVYVHGDFGSHNFAFDDASGMPVGVFDFHEAGRAPRAHDLKLLPSYGDDAFAIALDRYAARAKTTLDERDVRIAHAITALAYLAWRAEDPDAHDRGSGRDRAAAIAWANAAVHALQ